MSFDSYTYAVFLAAVLLLHRALPWRAGRVMLAVASYLFYGWAVPWYCLLLFTSTLVDFLVAQRIAATQDDRSRKGLVGISLAANLGLLGAFKYGPFILATWSDTLALLGAAPIDAPSWALPVGISFYTFQTISYTIDVYYDKIPAQRNFVSFALYVAFFPQLVAGPIERGARLMPQLEQKQKVRRDDLEQGFQRILWGVVKKVVVADRLGIFVDAIYGAPEEASAAVLVVATACFMVQVYYDFSAYCDIALGSARLLGIRLSENFLWPIFARNPGEFWARWHVTLGQWFRDYLLTALGGRKRRGRARKLFNGVAVLTLMGLWHGAAWNFVLFGVGAGLALVAHRGALMIKGGAPGEPLLGRGRGGETLAIALNTLHILFLMVLFRASSPRQIWTISTGIAGGPWTMSAEAWVYLAIAATAWLCSAAHSRLQMPERRDIELAAPLRAAFWAALILGALYGAVDTRGAFIYFQF